MSTKLSENLSLKNLFTAYPFTTIIIGGQAICPFTEALKNGSIDNLIKECADTMYAGNTLPVIKQLIENLQNRKCLDKNRVKSITQVKSEEAIDAFLKHVMELRSEHPDSKSNGTTGGKAKWAYDIADIDAIDDAAELTKVVNSMATYNSRVLPDLPMDKQEEFIEAYAHARKRLINLKKASKVEVSTNLLTKLQKGGKATLSASEAAELLKLLQK